MRHRTYGGVRGRGCEAPPTRLSLVPAISNQAKAAMSVIDSANLANSAKQVVYWAEQLAAMKNQLDQAKEQYKAITGSRGLGDILNNPNLRQYLPIEYQNIYDATSRVHLHKGT